MKMGFPMWDQKLHNNNHRRIYRPTQKKSSTNTPQNVFTSEQQREQKQPAIAMSLHIGCVEQFNASLQIKSDTNDDEYNDADDDDDHDDHDDG